MKNSDVIKFLYNRNVISGLSSKRFTVAEYKNTEMMKSHVEAIEKIQQPTPEFKKIQDSIRAKYAEHADKDSKGNPKTKVTPLPDGRNYQEYVVTIPMNQAKIDEFVKKAKSDNAEIFEDQERRSKEYVEAMDEDCGLQFIKIDEDELPENITPEQLELVSFMVNFKK